MTLRQKPFETSYPKWRHLKYGYVVRVQKILNYQGANGGYYSTVTVEGTRKGPKLVATWSADSFRKNFEPIGRKQTAKSALDRLLKD
jgi:hypothetical protein